MDLDYARERIQKARDVDPLSDVLLELLALIGVLGNDIAALKQRVQSLEKNLEP